jgi:prepilin-type N-terminal cleavage/methylation domain-containing protein
MRKFRRHRLGTDSEGFSLIEVMIALTFLGIGLLAIAQLIPLGMLGISEARVRTIAVQSAQQRMDELKMSSFSSAALTAGTYTEAAGRYTMDWTITDNDPVPGSKRIDMTATWPHLSGTRSARLTTYVTARR